MINQQRLINTFLDLVKIDSPTGREREVGDFVLKTLNDIGIKAKRDKTGNIIIKLSGPGQPLFLNAHLDTVQPGEGIKPRIKNGIIMSDGATILGADNKAVIAAIIEALRWFKRNNTRPLEIVFTVSEEGKNLGALNLDYLSLKSRCGFCFDCGERLGNIILESPFYDSFNILIQGKSSHSAFPEKGINALKITCQAIGKLKLGKIDKFTVLNIGIIQGGSARNVVPGEIRLSGEIRSFRKENLEKYEREVCRTFETVAFSAGARVQVKIQRENNSYNFKKSALQIKRTTEILRELGLKVRHKKTWTCSDANIFNEKGIKVLNLGDGVRNPHTCQESIKVEDLISLTELIIKLIQDFSCD